MSEWSSEKITSTGFDAKLKGENGFEIHFYTDKREAYLAVEKVCRQFIDHKLQTNADRIRSMSDEELDKFLGEVQWDVANYCGGVTQKQEYPVPEQMGAWLEWLKEEVKDG